MGAIDYIYGLSTKEKEESSCYDVPTYSVGVTGVYRLPGRLSWREEEI